MKKLILFFAAVLLLNFSAKSQNSSDSIIIIQKWGTLYYYKNNAPITKWEVSQLLYEDETATRLMRSSNNFRNAGYLLAIPGGACLGFGVGNIIAKSVQGQLIDLKIIAPLLAGAAASVVGIMFEVTANQKAYEAIAIYNRSKVKNLTIFNLGLSSNGINLSVKF